MEPEEIAEIWEEDRNLAEQLDDLMDEFEADYDELGIPLTDFFYDHWWRIMDEIDAGRDALSPEDMEAIREIGVILSG